MSAENEQHEEIDAETEETSAELSSDESAVPADSAERSQDPAHLDPPVSTVVALMGVASSRELSLLERKVDLATQKVAQIGNRLDRVSEQMLELFHDIDRTNVQFGDLKDFLKNILSAVLKNVDDETREQLSGNAKNFNDGKPAGSADDNGDEEVNIVSSE